MRPVVRDAGAFGVIVMYEENAPREGCKEDHLGDENDA
jgi:hypothetical protein